MAQIVAGRVGPILGELLAEAEIGRAVQSGDEPVHHGLGDQVEAGDAGQDVGIEEALHHSQAFGGGMSSSSRLQDVVGVDAVGFRVEIEQDAVPQHRDGQRGDVLVGHVVAAASQRAGLGRQHQELRGAHAGAVVDVLLDEVRGARRCSCRVARTRSTA